MADDDDVPDLQHVGRELDHRQAVEVGVDDDVGDVAVDEELARREIDEVVRRHAAVGAADPEILRRLLLQEAGEEAGPRGFHLLRPPAVVLEQFAEIGHGHGDDAGTERDGAVRTWRVYGRRRACVP